MPSSELFEDPLPQIDGSQAFALYEHVRHRLPAATFSGALKANAPTRAASLLAIAEQYDTFVFDAYGVLNTGLIPIPGATECVAGLRELGKQVFVLTNAASQPAANNVPKFSALGFDFTAEEIVSSRAAAEKVLETFPSDFLWGAGAAANFTPDQIAVPIQKLADEQSAYDDVDGFVLFSIQDWNADRQLRLERSLKSNLRPVIVANPDIVAPVGGELSTEPGYLGHRLVERLGADVQFHGKPFPSVYDIVEARMTARSAGRRVVMIGDTLHTDVLGGAARGWDTVLVTGHGLFKGLDPNTFIYASGIVPHWMVHSI